MKTTCDRRELLAAASVCTGTVALAGCSFNPFGCGEMHQTSVSATEAKLTENQRANLSIIVASDLPEGEKEVIREAIRSDEYAECHPGSEVLQSFVERVKRRKAEQFESYDGTPPEYLNSAYASHDATNYELSVTVEDEVI